NESLLIALLNALSRIEGDKVFFEALVNPEIWKSSPQVIRALTIEATENRLGADYRFLGVSSFECTKQHRLARFEHIDSGITLHLLPGGQYKMGIQNPRWSMDRQAQPVHEVTVPPFLIAETPTTQAQWDRIGSFDRRHFDGPDLPIDGVSADDIDIWMGNANAGFRLPSESEWEYACRAGTDTVRFWGDDMDSSYCWIATNSGDRIHSVKEHLDKRNNYGLVDMLGNVFEWTQDYWSWNYEDGPNTEAPKKMGDPTSLVTKGGDYHYDEAYCRSGMRFQATNSGWWKTNGFRVARSL
ncbi:MAG: formylglycine-generating enzyme family protein, partial [Planctomycetota bacterium]|nr:formylglycine-generating enzyme family protein [Planctomycetota bacterium]